MVLLSVEDNTPTGASINPSNITFTSQDKVATFTVSISEDSVGLEGIVHVEVSGENALAYTVEENQIEFSVSETDGSSPSVVEFANEELDRNSASFTTVVNEESVVYWMVGRRGTRSPTVSEVI